VDPVRAAAALEAWYAQHARDLPWRRHVDAYHTLLVEFLLQQTRIETGLPYYERFVQRFPTIGALAAAPESDVLALWSGLGYYRRARNLHRTAKEIVTRHAGRVPDDPALLDALPGIGPYTAGAIASIAYDRPVPCVDGNQARVLGRLLGIHDPDSKRGRTRIDAWARRLLAHGSPRRLNQALMDLGSSVCVPRQPRCAECPLAPGCRSRDRPLTRRAKAGTTPVEDWDVVVHRRGDRIWLRAPATSGLMADTWMPPLRRSRATKAPDFVHDFSHKRWRLRMVQAKAPPRGVGRWVAAADLAKLPHGRLTRRVFEWAGRVPATRRGDVARPPRSPRASRARPSRARA